VFRTFVRQGKVALPNWITKEGGNEPRAGNRQGTFFDHFDVHLLTAETLKPADGVVASSKRIACRGANLATIAGRALNIVICQKIRDPLVGPPDNCVGTGALFRNLAGGVASCGLIG
jgi:hypothetical protein